MNQTQYAAHRGVSKMAVSKAVKAGRIKLVDGKIDPVSADRAWGKNTRTNASNEKSQERKSGIDRKPIVRASTGAREDGPVPGSLAHAQLVHETAKARKAALEAQRMEGTVVNVEDAVAQWGRMISSTRAAILLVPDVLAPKLAPVSDVRECRVLLAAEMARLLTGLSEYRPHE